MIQPLLETDRLVLRPYKMADAQQVYELVGDFEVAKTTRLIPHPYTLAMAKEWISTHQEMLNQGTGTAYAITDRLIGNLYGTVSLVHSDGYQAALGYWIGRQYWNNGYCSEAVKSLLDFAFNQLNLTRIVAEHLTSNGASGQVMKKNNMTHIGVREAQWRDSSIVQIEIYEVLNTKRSRAYRRHIK